jgi:hypothetical protein
MFDHMLAAFRATGREFPNREGTSYTQLLPVMVPRSVWPIETETAGVSLRKVIEPFGIGGRPSSAMGEGYMNFRLVGALVPMFFMGVWCRFMQVFMIRNEGRSSVAPLFYAFMLLATPRLLTGVMPLALRELLLRLAAVAVSFGWSARMPRRDGSDAEMTAQAPPTDAQGPEQARPGA